MRNFLSRIKRNYKYRDNDADWDQHVFAFLDKVFGSKHFSYLEVGSGLCKWVSQLPKQYPNIEITCIEINPDLAQIAKDNGFHVINKNVLEVNDLEQYDVVHCSHVIEHFKYPEVANLLDFLSSSTKKGGYTIIRTPLLWEKFYYDLDHVRPYPPEAVINYFHNCQQQKVGKAEPIVLQIQYMVNPLCYNNLQPWNLLFRIRPLSFIYNHAINCLNSVLKFFWNFLRYPCKAPKGYTIFLTYK